MKNTAINSNRHTHHWLRRTLSILGWSVGSIIILCILILVGATLYLTPDRLTKIVNREASEYFRADVRASNIRFHVWSTFPRLAIRTDSILITSRSLDSISPEIKHLLPEDASQLVSLKSFEGEINLIDFISKRFVLHNVHADGLTLNLLAYDDSIANYNILPDDSDGFKEVPYIRANIIALDHPGLLKYRSMQSDTYAEIALRQFSLKRHDTHASRKEMAALSHSRHADTYDLSLDGKITAASGGLTVLNNFPVALSGDIRVAFGPFAIDMSDYAINLGNLRGRLDMSLGVGDNPQLSSFDYHLSSLNLMKLLSYLPERYLPDLTGVNAELPIEATARLTSPWRISSGQLPSLEVDFTIPEGEVGYTLSSRNNLARSRHYTLSHSPIQGKFLFYGDNPAASRFIVPQFNIASSGVDCQIAGSVTRLTADPHFEIAVGAQADIKRVLAQVPTTLPIKAAGNFSTNLNLTFNLSDFSDASLMEGLYAVKADGKARIGNLKAEYPKDSISLIANDINIDFGGNAARVTQQKIMQALADAKIGVGMAAILIPEGEISFDNLRLRADSKSKTSLSATSDPLHSLPVDLLISADSASFITEGEMLHIADMRGKIRVGEYGSMGFSDPTSVFAEADADALALLPHSPEYLAYSAPQRLKQIMSSVDFDTHFKIGEVEMRSHGHDTGNGARDIEVALNPDRVKIYNLDMTLADTRMRMAGEVEGLRPFILHDTPEPLDIRLKVALDTVNINKLAQMYYQGHGGVPKGKTSVAASAGDSIAMLVPRNITATIDASAAETVYSNLHLYDLYTTLILHDGVAKVDGLNISSDFGHAGLNLTYDTSDIDNIGFKGDVALSHINVVNFFKNFHSLLLMMPEMSNLKGMLSLEGTIEGGLFPDMVVNVPAFNAGVSLHGRGLTVHQSDFIRHITKMMLIRTDDDLHIANMDVNADITDNMIMLYPFNFEFDAYKLRMEGLNNFNGRLYYHIGVLQSPIHIPFAINIEGMFRHPHLRFGGPSFNARKGMEVSRRIQEENDLNIVNMMKSFAGEFLRKAAQTAENPSITL